MAIFVNPHASPAHPRPSWLDLRSGRCGRSHQHAPLDTPDARVSIGQAPQRHILAMEPRPWVEGEGKGSREHLKATATLSPITVKQSLQKPFANATEHDRRRYWNQVLSNGFSDVVAKQYCKCRHPTFGDRRCTNEEAEKKIG
jgi:hypothetical protein